MLVLFSLLCLASSLVTATLDAVPIILRKIVSKLHLIFTKLSSSISDFQRDDESSSRTQDSFTL